MAYANTDIYRWIMKREGLKDWSYAPCPPGEGLVLRESKTILAPEKNLAMFLHEVAHATSGEKHTGLFADVFTELVKTYMLPRGRKIQKRASVSKRFGLATKDLKKEC